MSFQSDFRVGVRAISPLLPAVATVGLVTGLAATAIGLSAVQAVAMSVLIYSPTVILTAIELIDAGAPGAIVVLAAFIVAARFSMLSLSIAPYFDRFSSASRWVLAYFLWTATYAVALERFEADTSTDPRGFYLGTGVPVWVTLQASLIAGIVFGASVPPTWELRFVVPLAFIALVMRMVPDRATKGAAAMAAVVALAAGQLPLNLGLLVATIVGIIAGVGVERRWGT